MNLFASLLAITLSASAVSAIAQTCSTYKGQLEGLLALPAGPQRIDGFLAKIPARTIKVPSGREVAFDGKFAEDGLRSGDMVTVETYLDYQLPAIKLKVTDSTTQGRRKINGRLVCIYETSLSDPQAKHPFEMDLELSDSGRAKFYVKTLISGDDPTRYAAVTPEVGQVIVLAVLTDALRARDARKPELAQSAEKVYLEKLNKAQAVANSKIAEYQVLYRQCAAIVAEGNEVIRLKDYDKYGHVRGRFTNTQCANTTLKFPLYP